MTAIPKFDVGDVLVEDADGTLIEITEVHQSNHTVWYSVDEEDRKGKTRQNQYPEDTLIECFTFVPQWSTCDCGCVENSGQFCLRAVHTGVRR